MRAWRQRAARRAARGDQTIRRTVPWLAVLPFAATVPLSTLVTNRSASSRSRGGHVPRPVDAAAGERLPHLAPLSSTIRQPGPETLPPLVGSEPTITQPLRRTLSAVVSPTPPGQPGRCGLTWANSDRVAARAHLDDRGPGALCVGLVVEVADQDVSLAQVSGVPLDDGHAVRVDVTVGLDGQPSVVTWCRGPTNAGKLLALAAPAPRPMAASKPAAVVTTAARPAYRLVDFISFLLPSDGKCPSTHGHVPGPGLVRTAGS